MTIYLEPFYKKNERKRISQLMWGISAFWFFTMLGYYILLWLSGMVSYQVITDSNFNTVLSYFGQYLVAFPVTLLMMAKVSPDPVRTSDITADEWFGYLCIACSLMFAGVMIASLVNYGITGVTGQTPNTPAASVSSANLTEFLLNTIASVGLAPVAEELIFRKFLLDRVNRLGDAAAILISGLTFGLLHGNFSQFFYAVLAGMLFAWIYLQTGQIRYTILLHMMINFLFGVIPDAFGLLPAGTGREICWQFYDIGELVLVAAGVIWLILRVIKRHPRPLKSWLNASGSEIAGVVILNPGMIVFFLLMVLAFFVFYA